MNGERLDRWEARQAAAYRVIPFFLLAVSVPLAILEDPGSWPLTVAIAAVAFVWLAVTQTRGPRWLHLTGLLALIVVAVAHNPLFGFFAFSGYLAADGYTGRWLYVAVAIVAVASGTAQVGGVPLQVEVWAWAAVVAINLVVAPAMMFFGQLVEHRNRRLQETLAENARLQAQLVAQARDAGVQEERERMAGEIHDTLAQGLAGIIAQLEALEHARRTGADWSRHLDTASQLARESLREARRSVRAVGPAALDDTRLPDAIAEVAHRWSDIHGVATQVTTTGAARPLHPDVEVTLLRAAQEALANVGKHAGAARVGVTLSYMEDVVTLDVRDDGAGFTPNGSNGGYGLIGMRQRVQRLAGRLEVESEPGSGTAVSASVPAIPAEGVA